MQLTSPRTMAFQGRRDCLDGLGRPSYICVLVVISLLTPRLVTADPIVIANVQRAEAVSFEKDILPILQRNCLACHSASERQGELVLESPDAMRKGGDNGPALIPGRGADSLLLKLAAHQAEPNMPPSGNDVNAKPMTSEELGLVRLWIDQGASGGSAALLSPKAWRSLPSRISPVYSLDLTEDGQYLVASRANQLFLYHVPTGRMVTTLSDPALDDSGAELPAGIAHRDLVQSVALNRDGNLLASGSFREVKLWRRPRDVQLLNLAADAPLTAVAVSPDRQWIATADATPAIQMWNANTGERGVKMSGHTDRISSLRFTQDGRLISASVDQSVRFWNATDGSLTGLLETPGAVNAVDVTFIPEAVEGQVTPPAILVSGGPDKLLRTWTLPQAAPKKWEAVPNGLVQTAVSLDKRFVALAGSDQMVRVMQRGGDNVFTQLAEWKLDAGVVVAMTFVTDATAPPADPAQPAPPRLATTAADGSISLWSLPGHELLAKWRGSLVSATAIAASHDGKRLATGAEDGAVSLWDLSSQTPPAVDEQTGVSVAALTLSAAGQPMRALAFHSNGQTLFTAAQDGSLRGYNTANGQQTFATSHGAAITALALSPNEQVLATAGENAVVRLWQTNGGAFGPQQLIGLSGPARSVAFSADGTQVLAGGAGEKPGVIVFDLRTGAPLQRFTSHQQPVVAFAVSGQPTETPRRADEVLSIAVDSAWQWTTHAGRTIPGHGADITSLAQMPGAANQILSGSTDATIRHWNLDNRQQIRQFNHGGPVLAVAVRPDGQRVASVSGNHTAKLWNLNGQQIAEMRGDVRLKTQVVRSTQQQTSATTRVAVAKQRADAAEKDVPVKMAAEKKAAETLAAASKDVTDKQAAVDKAQTEKIAAEKEAIEAAAAARVTIVDKTTAEDALKRTQAAVPIAQQRAAQLAAAANATPANESLKTAAAESQQAVAAAQQQVQQLQEAVKAPTQAVVEATAKANAAAQKVTTVQKPYNDALAAMKIAMTAQNLASQQHVIAARELQSAQDLAPIAKQAVTASEAALEEAKKQLETATKASSDADLAIRSVSFSPDGAVLLTGGDSPNVHTWDAETGTAVGAYAGHTAGLASVGFLDDEKLVSIGTDQSVRVWQRNPEWRLERTIGAVDQPDMICGRVMTLDFNADASQLLVGGGVPSRNGELLIFNVADGQRVLYLPQAHDDVIYAARFSPDGKRIASAGADKYLRTFDIASSQMLRRFEGHTNYVLSVAWKGDGQTLASAAADSTIKVWDAETADQRRTIENFNKHVTQVVYIGETDNIVSSCGDRIVRVHNAANGGNVRNFGGSDGWLHCVDVVADSSLVATGSDKGTVFVWNGNNGQQLKTLKIGELPDSQDVK
ncbi:MAG: c-type cytochrome domain-containing protein [Planctomycetota bacterium]